MLEQIRSAIQMASSLTEVPRKQAERLARDLVKQGEIGASAVGSVAEEIVRKSRENAGLVRTLVGSELRRQIKSLGLVNRDDIERLQKRVFGLATKQDIDRLNKRVDGLAKPKTPTRTPAKPKSTKART